MTIGSADGRTARRRRGITAVVAASVALSAIPLAAQVGRPPSSSPYRDIPRQAGPVISIGYWNGARGKVDVGITSAIMGGVSYDLSPGGPFRVMAGFWYGQGERYVLDPTEDAADRRSGPFNDGFLMAEAEVQLLITGHKSWRGFAPYLSAAGGFILGGAEPAADTSDYQLGSKIVFGPAVGLRWYPGGRLSALLDARLFFLKLRYPAEYYVPASDGTAVLDFTEDDEEWTRSPRFRLGIGWTF